MLGQKTSLNKFKTMEIIQKEIETIKINHTEILVLKNTMISLKCSTEEFNSRLEEAE